MEAEACNVSVARWKTKPGWGCETRAAHGQCCVGICSWDTSRSLRITQHHAKCVDHRTSGSLSRCLKKWDVRNLNPPALGQTENAGWEKPLGQEQQMKCQKWSLNKWEVAKQNNSSGLLSKMFLNYSLNVLRCSVELWRVNRLCSTTQGGLDRAN